MAYLIPPNVTRSYSGDISLWNGYELVETPLSDGRAVHQTAIQDVLNVLKNIDDSVQIHSIVTCVYEKGPPMPVHNYLTTIWYAVMGNPLAFPVL